MAMRTRTNPLLPPQVAPDLEARIHVPVVDAYTRISEDPNDLSLGVGRQYADEVKLSKDLGCTIRRQRCDNDTSAWKPGVVRPEFEALLVDLADDVIDGALFAHPDRLARDPMDLERLIKICDAARERGRQKLIGFVGLPIDITTDFGKMILRQMISAANMSSADTSRRVKRQKVELALEGRSLGGSRAFGWDWITKEVVDRQGVTKIRRDREVINSIEAAAIRWSADQVLVGVPLNVVARALNDYGILTPRGHRWSRQTLCRMLLSPRLCGRVIHQGKPVFDADGQPVLGKQFDPILDDETWSAVWEVLSSRTAVQNRSDGQRKYLLSGIATCTVCLTAMVGNYRNDPKRGGETFFYRCDAAQTSSDRHSCSASGPTLDAIVSALVATRLVGAVAPVEAEAPVWVGAAELAKLEQKVAEVMQRFHADELDAADMTAAVRPLRHRLTELQQQQREFNAADQGARRSVRIESVEQFLALPASHQRAHIEREIETIWIRPATRRTGPKFDHARVAVQWRE